MHRRDPAHLSIRSNDVDDAGVGEERHRQLRDRRQRILVVERRREDAARLGQEAKRLLGAPLLGDVVHRGDRGDDAAIAIENRRGAHGHEAARAITARHAKWLAHDPLSMKNRPRQRKLLGHELHAARRRELPLRISRDVRRGDEGTTQDLLELLVAADELARRRLRDDQPCRHLLDDRVEPRALLNELVERVLRFATGRLRLVVQTRAFERERALGSQSLHERALVVGELLLVAKAQPEGSKWSAVHHEGYSSQGFRSGDLALLDEVRISRRERAIIADENGASLAHGFRNREWAVNGDVLPPP
jgi:hypothetical protein